MCVNLSVCPALPERLVLSWMFSAEMYLLKVSVRVETEEDEAEVVEGSEVASVTGGAEEEEVRKHTVYFVLICS